MRVPGAQLVTSIFIQKFTKCMNSRNLQAGAPHYGLRRGSSLSKIIRSEFAVSRLAHTATVCAVAVANSRTSWEQNHS
jgi:hypothetical protein